MLQGRGGSEGPEVAGGHVAHVYVVRHLVARHDVDMLGQHSQVEQSLHDMIKE